MKKIFTFLAILLISSAAVFAQVDGAEPDGTSFLFDGFEKGNYWIWAGFDWDQYELIFQRTGLRKVLIHSICL